MLHPVGAQPPSVYWRRRLFVLFALTLAVVSTLIFLHSGSSASNPGAGGPSAGAGAAAGGNSPSGSSAASTAVGAGAGSATGASTAGGVVAAASNASPVGTGLPPAAIGSPPAPGSGSSPPAPVTATAAGAPTSPGTPASPPAPAALARCAAAQLSVTAAADAASYRVGAKPKLALVVTNRGPLRCVADMSDSQIELRVFSGKTQVWSSHDCAVVPGSSPQTLPVAAPVRREIEWSGLTSQPGCTQPRQRLSVGSYSTVAILSGEAGTPVGFTFTP